MNRFRQQRQNERWQQRMDARAQVAQVTEVHAVTPDLSFMAPPCLTFLGQERLPRPLTRLAMLSLVLSLGLAACSPTEASPTALSSAPQVTLEPTFVPTFTQVLAPTLPATLEATPNAPATQEAFLLGTVEALVQSGINAEKSGEGWILSRTDAQAQKIELGEIQKVGDSYRLVFTTTEGNPASENLALLNYDQAPSSWVISEPDHHWPVYRLAERGWEQLLFRVNPDAAQFQDPSGNIMSGIREVWPKPEEGVIYMRIFGYGQSLQVKEEDVRIAQHGVIYNLKEQHVIITVVLPIEGSTWGIPIDLVSNISMDASGNIVEAVMFFPDNILFNPDGSQEDWQKYGRLVSHDELRTYLAQGSPIFFGNRQVDNILKLMESSDQVPGGGSVEDVNNFLLLRGVKTDDGAKATCSSREACVKLLDEKGLTDTFISTWGLPPHFVDELRMAIQRQPQIPLSRIRLRGHLAGIGEPVVESKP